MENKYSKYDIYNIKKREYILFIKYILFWLLEKNSTFSSQNCTQCVV